METMNTAQAADILGLSIVSICQMLNKGYLAGRKNDAGKWVIEASSVNRFKNLMTVREAAEKSNYSTQTIKLYLREGKITGEKIGHVWYINKKDFSQWLSTRQ